MEVTHHAGGTWNDCESSFAPESFPIGTFNGVDDSIIFTGLPFVTVDITSVSMSLVMGDDDVSVCNSSGSNLEYFFHISGTTIASGNSGTPVYSVDGVVVTDMTPYVGDGLMHLVTVTGLDLSLWTGALQFSGYVGYMYGGVLRNATISTPTHTVSIPINEGDGTAIRDSEGNNVGTANVSLPAFWAGAWMVAQSIIDAEAASTTAPYLCDLQGHPLPMTQADWGELGSEEVTNGTFDTDDLSFFTDLFSTDAEVVDSELKLTVTSADSSGTAILARVSGLVVGGTYRISGEMMADASNVRAQSASLAVTNIPTPVIHAVATNGKRGRFGYDVTLDVAKDYLDLYLRCRNASTGYGYIGDIAYFDNISIREVNQVINNNKQYYFCAEAGLFINKRVLTAEEHLEYVEFLYNNCYQEFEALINSETGNMVYNDPTNNIIYDEEA